MARDTKYVSPVSDDQLLTIFAAVRLRLSSPDAWCKGKPRCGEAVDLPHALEDACRNDRRLYHAVRDVLDAAGTRNIFQFNDGATHDEVLALLDACGEVIRTRHQRERRKDRIVWGIAAVVLALVFVFMALAS
jgi:predicted nucleic acid-binding Zn ribbon protein